MPSPFPWSPVNRECSWKKTQIEKNIYIYLILWLFFKNSSFFLLKKTPIFVVIDRFASLSEIKSTIFLKINIRWIVKETTENAYKTFQNYLTAKKKVGNRHHKYDGIWFKQQAKKILCGYSKTKCCIIQKQVSELFVLDCTNWMKWNKWMEPILLFLKNLLHFASSTMCFFEKRRSW